VLLGFLVSLRYPLSEALLSQEAGEADELLAEAN
jgi:hypothetical protein